MTLQISESTTPHIWLGGGFRHLEGHCTSLHVFLRLGCTWAPVSAAGSRRSSTVRGVLYRTSTLKRTRVLVHRGRFESREFEGTSRLTPRLYGVTKRTRILSHRFPIHLPSRPSKQRASRARMTWLVNHHTTSDRCGNGDDSLFLQLPKVDIIYQRHSRHRHVTSIT